MTLLRLINPQELPVPKGYTHGVLAEGEGKMLCVAGQIGWDGSGKMAGEDMASQFRQALKNVGTVLKTAGGTPESILKMTIHITSKDEYLRFGENIGREYRTFMGKHSPAMTLLVVKDLMEPGAKVSVEITAVVPEKGPGATEFQRHGQGASMPDAGLRGRPGPRK